MTTKDIFAPYEVDGRSTMILTGRSIYDFECREDGSITTLVKLMAEYAKGLHLVLVRYSLADGLIVPYNAETGVSTSSTNDSVKGMTVAPSCTNWRAFSSDGSAISGRAR